MLHALSFLDVCFFGVGVYFVKRLLDSRRTTPLPPGPTGWPVVGNLFQIPSEKNWEAFAALGKIYGTYNKSSHMSFSQILRSKGKFRP